MYQFNISVEARKGVRNRIRPDLKDGGIGIGDSNEECLAQLHKMKVSIYDETFCLCSHIVRLISLTAMEV